MIGRGGLQGAAQGASALHRDVPLPQVSNLKGHQVAELVGLQSERPAVQIHQGAARPRVELSRAFRLLQDDSQSAPSAAGAWSVSGLPALQSPPEQEQPCGLPADDPLRTQELPQPALRVALPGPHRSAGLQQDGLLALQRERLSLPELLASPPRALARLPATSEVLPGRELTSSSVSRRALLWRRLSSPASLLPPLPQHPPAHENTCEPFPPGHAPANSSASSSQ